MSEFQPHSHRTQRTRRFAVMGALALVLLGGFAPAALAAKVKLQYSCVFPLIRAQPLTLEIDAAAPSPAIYDVPIGTFPVSAVATDGGTFGLLMDTVGATQLSGSSVLKTAVTAPGLAIGINVALSTPATSYADGTPSRTWTLTGSFPSLRLRQVGTVSFAATTLAMHLIARDLDGAVISFDAFPQPTVDDNNPDTMDVPCTLAPTTQPATFTTTQVYNGPDTVAPTKPGTPVASEITESSVRLRWAASSDAFGVTGYDVFRNGTKVGSVSDTTMVVNGLGRGSTRTFTVVAKDPSGNASVPSDPVTVTTLPARPPVTIAFSCRFPLIGPQPISVAFDVGIPSLIYKDLLTGAFPVRSVITTGGDISTALSVFGATSVEGRATPVWRVDSTARSLRMAVPANILKLEFPPENTDPLTLVGMNTMPSLMFRQAGPGTITLETLRLNLIARQPDGTPIQFEPVPGVADSDGNPDTFDTPCTFSPDGQNKLLATFDVV